MKRYARVDSGVIVEFYSTDDDITKIHHPSLIWVCIDDVEPAPDVGWSASQTDDDWVFAPPVPYVPTAAETLSQNTYLRDSLMVQAGLAIAPLQDAVDLGDATEGETLLLTKWKQYRVALNRINLTLINPAWPAPPLAA